jgi:spore germination protein KA
MLIISSHLKKVMMLIFRMIHSLFAAKLAPAGHSPDDGTGDVPKQFSPSLAANIETLKELFGPSTELVIRQITVDGEAAAVVSLDGLLDRQVVAEAVLRPLLEAKDTNCRGKALQQHVMKRVLATSELMEQEDASKALDMLMIGFLLIFIDGCDSVLAAGNQGFFLRGIGASESEVSLYGSREAFTEVLNINMTMMRRRAGNHKLHFERMIIGTKSRTHVMLAYIDGTANKGIVDDIRKKLQSVKINVLLDATFLTPFLVKKPNTMFTPVCRTERPDILFAKLCEGRVGIMVNGTPFALYLPHLFHENFQNIDDYAVQPFYCVFLRTLKLLTFFSTMILPGLYVAIGTFHADLLPNYLLLIVAQSDVKTPFPLAIEALLMHLAFEVIREAGIRMPKAIGGAVSIVGALVLGDAAVSAGLVGAPMVLVVALSAIGSFVVPNLYEPVSVVRLALIAAAGIAGIYGVMAVVTLVMAEICSLNVFGIPYTAPLSPLSANTFRDTIFRVGWRKLAQGVTMPNDMAGSEHYDGEI